MKVEDISHTIDRLMELAMWVVAIGFLWVVTGALS